MAVLVYVKDTEADTLAAAAAAAEARGRLQSIPSSGDHWSSRYHWRLRAFCACAPEFWSWFSATELWVSREPLW